MYYGCIHISNIFFLQRNDTTWSIKGLSVLIKHLTVKEIGNINVQGDVSSSSDFIMEFCMIDQSL